MKLSIFVGILQVLNFEFLKFRILEIMNFHPCSCTFSFKPFHSGYLQTCTLANSEDLDEMLHEVKNQMKCRIMRHFIRICTGCKDLQIFMTEMHHNFKFLPVTPKIVNGQFCNYSFNLHGKIHQNKKGG